MDEIIKSYDANSLIYSRIESCLKGGEKFAIPIESFALFKTPVSFKKLKNIDEHFTAPRCYLNLKNYPVVFNYLKMQDCYDVEWRVINAGEYRLPQKEEGFIFLLIIKLPNIIKKCRN